MKTATQTPIDELLYLVAHAPADPWKEFEPAGLPAAPQAPCLPEHTVWGFSPDQIEAARTWMHGESDLTASWASHFVDAWSFYRRAQAEHNETVAIMRRAQWPWWWARQILQARPLDEPDTGNDYAGYLVVCNDDSDQGLKRVLCTRRVFTAYADASMYAGSIASGRQPEVIGILKPCKIVC